MRVFLLFLITWSTLSFAQTKTNKVTVTDGPENDAKRSSVLGIFGYDNTGYYTLRTQKKNVLVEHLNTSMAVDKSIPMEKLTVGKTKLAYYSSVQLGENFYFFYTQYDSRERKMTLYAKELNKSTLLTEGDLIEIGTTTFASRRSFMQNAVYASYSAFSLVTSPDKSRLLLITHDMGKDEGEETASDKIKMTLTVFDSNLKKNWSTEATLGFSPELFTVTNVALDDDGNVSILGIEYQEKLTAKALKRAGKPTYTYHLIRYADKGDSKTELPIELTGKFITDLRVETAPNGDVIVAGFYSEKGSFSIKGAFYMSIDPATESVKREKFSEFGSEFITMNMTNREEKKAKKKEDKGEELEMNEFDMRQLLVRNDGGATLIAEQYIFYTTTSTTYVQGKPQTTTTYHYLYNDIIAISFDAEGTLLWKTKIPKRQHTTNDGGYYSSYALAVVGDKLFFIFNDNPKNLFLPKDEAPYNFSASRELAVVIVEVNSKGESTKELLFTSERGDCLIRPKIAEQTDENEMIICGQRSKIFQYSKLTFK